MEGLPILNRTALLQQNQVIAKNVYCEIQKTRNLLFLYKSVKINRLYYDENVGGMFDERNYTCWRFRHKTLSINKGYFKTGLASI